MLESTNGLIEFSPRILIAVPLVVALVQLLKEYVGARLTPLLSLVMGVAVAFLVTDVPWNDTILQGLAAGVMAVGTFSGVRATVQG